MMGLPWVCVGRTSGDKIMGGTSQATAGFHDSDFFQKAIKMVLSVIFFSFQDSNFNPVPPM